MTPARRVSGLGVVAAFATLWLTPSVSRAFSTVPQSGPVFDRTTVLAISALGLGALAARHTDTQRIGRFIDSSPLDGSVDFANVYGDGAVLGAGALGLMALGAANGSPRLSACGRDLTTSLLTAWAATWAIKLSVDARRPNGGRYSFPSGHTATAFAAAPVIARYFGDAAGVVAYGVAALAGAARVEENKHHPSDVLAGAAVGIVAGRLRLFHGRLGLVAMRAGVGLGIDF